MLKVFDITFLFFSLSFFDGTINEELNAQNILISPLQIQPYHSIMSPLEMLHGDDEVSSLVRYQNSSSMEHHVDHEQHDTITTLSMLSSRRAPSTSRIVQPPSKEQTSDIAKRLSQVDKQLCTSKYLVFLIDWFFVS